MSLLLSCEPGGPEPPQTGISDVADAAGNLLIDNRLSEPLYLYHNGQAQKQVPAGSEGFLVNIDSDGLDETLKIWKVADVADPSAPDEEYLFKRWDLVLETDAIPAAECPLWIIQDTGGGTASGTLSFSYQSQGRDGLSVLYSADVYLNSKSGARVTSIAPGMQDKRIGLEYNYYVVYYLYWYDDPRDTAGRYDIDWIPGDASDPLIETVINAANPSRELEVPIFYGANDGRVGSISIVNNTEEYVQVFANSSLIEDLLITNDPPDGLSILESDGGSYTYVVPQDTYTIEARSLRTNSSIATIGDVDVIEQYGFTWAIDGATTRRGVTVRNNTNERLTLHDHATGEYLGYVVEANADMNVYIPNSVTGLRALDPWGELGNYAASVVTGWSINDLIVMDFLAPQDVTGLTATADVGEVRLSWTNPGDSDFAGVRIVRKEGEAPLSPADGTAVYTGNENTCTDTGLSSAIPYHYRVWAYDRVPNYSAAGVTTTATPLSPTDVESLFVSPGDGLVQFTWTNPTDNWFSGVRIVRRTDVPPESPTNGMLIYDGTDESIADTDVVNENTYYYAVYAYDTAGNYSAGFDETAVPRAFIFRNEYPDFGGWEDSWGAPVRTYDSGNSYRMMGGYDNYGTGAYVRKTITDLPAGTYSVTFDFYFWDSWDGEYGQLSANGFVVWQQACRYSDLTGNLGNQGGGSAYDHLYSDVEVSFTHDGGDLQLVFTSGLNEWAYDESFGVDRVSLVLAGTP